MYSTSSKPFTASSNRRQPVAAERLRAEAAVQPHYVALDFALPPELLSDIFEDGIAQLLQQHAAEPTLAAREVQHFLVSASLVHRTWTPVAQELLLRNAYITLDNYRFFHRSLKQCSSAVVAGIQAVRFGGATRWATSHWNKALVDVEEVELTTRMVKKVMGMLPGLKEVEFTKLAVWELEWLPKDASITHARFLDSTPLLRSPYSKTFTSRRSSPIPRFTFIALHPDPTYVSWFLDHSIYYFVQAHTGITSLSFTNLGGTHAITAVCRVGWGRSPSCSQMEELTIAGNYTNYANINCPIHGSPWKELTSLKKLSAPLSVFSGDPHLYGALPPTIRTLHVTPEAGNGLRRVRGTSRMEPSVGGWFVPKARQVLLQTVQMLAQLDELMVEEILQTEELVMECTRRGIRLRSVMRS